MIVVDTSVWIDYFNGTHTAECDRLDRFLGDDLVAVGDIILAEVLQGFRREADAQRALGHFRSLAILPMLGVDRAILAAERYRALRRRGVTIRKTADAMIASFCISEGHRLLASDRDFDPYAEHLGLSRA